MVSKPFVVSAVVLAFAGSLVGSVWMMSLFGVQTGGISSHLAFPLHRTLQIDGFLTVLIMGVGYMIVPRFRNSTLPSTKLAYVSLALALASIILSVISSAIQQPRNNDLEALSSAARLAGVAVFAGMVLWMLRIRPRLLGLADYFIGLSVVTLLALAAIRLSGMGAAGSLSEVQMLLLFPLLMVFGVEYKTMPSFLGFIRPRKRAAAASLVLAVAAVALGISSTLYNSAPALSMAFNAALLGCAATFSHALYFFGGFDNSQIMRLISGEKKARYIYTMAYSKLSFLFLFAGVALAALFSVSSSSSSRIGDVAGLSYLSYDLAIHLTAIGFIGTTITLYLPLMLPAITGRQVHFARFSHAPVLLLVAALALRAAGDAALATNGLLVLHQPPMSYLMMASGWMVVSALAAFVVMVHRSMNGAKAASANIGTGSMQSDKK